MPSEAYERALKATQRNHARQKTFSGRFLVRYLDDIRPMIERYRVRTVLDYGCGRAVAWRNTGLADELGVKVTLYDPGVPEYSKEPAGEFDMVICTQVLGSIPIEDLPWVLERIVAYSKKCVYIGERLGWVRKRIHADLVGEGLMPHGWTRTQWEEEIVRALRKFIPQSDVYLRTNDRRTKESLLGRYS